MGVRMLATTIILSLVSFLAGFIDSIAGGGGLLLVPSLLLAGLPPQTALGTNKFAATIGTSIALLNFIRNRKVVWKIAVYGIAFALMGGFSGSKAILSLDNRIVGKIIVFLLPVAALAVIYPRKAQPREKRDHFLRFDLFLKIPMICFSIGFYDGFFGPGTGSFFIICFYLFLDIDLLQASATTKVFNFLSNLGALVLFLFEGKVVLLLAIPLALANIAGNMAGSHLAIRKGAKVVRVFLLISLSGLFTSLVWQYFIKGR
jgi:uncharacterized membrane protein YfcA